MKARKRCAWQGCDAPRMGSGNWYCEEHREEARERRNNRRRKTVAKPSRSRDCVKIEAEPATALAVRMLMGKA